MELKHGSLYLDFALSYTLYIRLLNLRSSQLRFSTRLPRGILFSTKSTNDCKHVFDLK